MTAKLTASADGLSGSLAVGANEAFQFKPVAGGLELSQDGITFQTVDTNGGVSIKGGTVAPLAGFVGQVLDFTDNPTDVSSASFNGIGFATLTPGIWLLTGIMTYSITTGPCQMRSAGFSTTNSDFSGSNVLEQYSSNGGFGGAVALAPVVVVVGPGNLIMYVTGRAAFTGGSVNMGCEAQATRIA